MTRLDSLESEHSHVRRVASRPRRRRIITRAGAASGSALRTPWRHLFAALWVATQIFTLADAISKAGTRKGDESGKISNVK